MYSCKFEFDDFKYADEANKECNSDIMETRENDKIEDGSGSEEENGDLNTSGKVLNAMNKYVPDENYHLEWMDMHGDYKTNIPTELKWTYFEEPSAKKECTHMMDRVRV